MTLDDLKNIDINNLAGWLLSVKIGGIVLICVVLLFLGYYLLIADDITQHDAVQQKEQSLRQTFLDRKGLAVNLAAYRQQMEEMQQTFGTLMRQLPNKTEVPNLLVDITQAGLGRGLSFVLFKPDKEKPLEFYAELPVNIKVTGNYHQLGEFVSDIAALPRIVTIGGIEIAVDAKTSTLTMSAVARTFRYLEPEEIEALDELAEKAELPAEAGIAAARLGGGVGEGAILVADGERVVEVTEDRAAGEEEVPGFHASRVSARFFALSPLWRSKFGMPEGVNPPPCSMLFANPGRLTR